MSDEPTISMASAFVQMAEGRVDPIARHVLAEEHDIRLDEAAAATAGRNDEGRKVGAFEVGVAIRGFRRVEIKPVRVQPAEVVLQRLARRSRLAIHAADAIDPPVQVDHPFAAGRLVQPVHVLRQQQLGSAPRLERGQSAVRVVGLSPTHEPPADETARPIAPPRRFLAHEGLIGHRLGALPLPVRVAIVRDARRRAAAGAGQDEEALDADR